jgi:hypothetical protein
MFRASKTLCLSCLCAFGGIDERRVGPNKNGVVAEWLKAPNYESGGRSRQMIRGFESHPLRFLFLAVANMLKCGV